MASPAGGYGAGSGAEAHHHHQHHGHMMLHSHAHHMAAAAAAAAASGVQLFHVPQHSRREKLRFPPDAAAGDSPPTTLATQHQHQQQTGAWPPPAFYSYASSSSSYSPHSPTVAQGQLVPNGLAAQQQLPQIPAQNFSLSLSSASSNPASTPPTPRRQQQLGGPATAVGPYGPFTGYATVLGRSRFLGPAQKLLEEICDVGGAAAHVDRSVPDEGLLEGDPMDGADDAGHELDGADRAASDAGPISGAEQQWKKTRLISMMEEVCKRYRQYYQQVQAVISSFETVAGFSNAAPFAVMALRVMAKHFRHIKSMILYQLRNTSKIPVKEGISKDITIFGLGGGGGTVGFQRGGSVNGFGQPHGIWRPQRGLPERSVTVLRAWLFEHFLHPYPTDGDKQMLAKQTGLTRNQVSNWFINARVRLWKPMVEEIHNLEMRQIHKPSPLDKGQHGGSHNQTQHTMQRSGKRSEPCDSQPGQSSSITRNHHNAPASHGFQDELSQMSHTIQGQVTFAGYSALSSQQQHSMASPQHNHHHHHHASGAGNSGVSLTLGLHQNNRVCFGEPLPSTIPANLAHRFGLEDVSDPYGMGSFGGQDRHFAKEIGGHLLHDFVG